MNMVRHNFHTKNIEILFMLHRHNDLLEVFSDRFTLNFLLIIRTEYNVTLTTIYRCFSYSILIHI